MSRFTRWLCRWSPNSIVCRMTIPESKSVDKTIEQLDAAALRLNRATQEAERQLRVHHSRGTGGRF